jgi:hypothetical protein
MVGGDKDGQHRHIIGPSWVLRLLAYNSYETGCRTRHINLTLHYFVTGEDEDSRVFLIFLAIHYHVREKIKKGLSCTA